LERLRNGISVWIKQEFAMVEVMAGCRIIGSAGSQPIVLALGNALDEHEMDVSVALGDAMMPLVLARVIKQT
jgi:hypothetical protein